MICLGFGLGSLPLMGVAMIILVALDGGSCGVWPSVFTLTLPIVGVLIGGVAISAVAAAVFGVANVAASARAEVAKGANLRRTRLERHARAKKQSLRLEQAATGSGGGEGLGGGDERGDCEQLLLPHDGGSVP